MKRIMNDENDWLIMWNVEGPVDCVSRDEEVQVLNEMKIRKSPGSILYHWS